MSNEAKTKNIIRIAEIDWPEISTNDRQNQKVISRLEAIAARDPGNSEKQQAVENAKQLCKLIPRAKALKWEIFLYHDFFGYLAWDKERFNGHMTSYSGSSGTASVKVLENKISEVERVGIPEEVEAIVLDVYFTQLEDFLVSWYAEDGSE